MSVPPPGRTPDDPPPEETEAGGRSAKPLVWLLLLISLLAILWYANTSREPAPSAPAPEPEAPVAEPADDQAGDEGPGEDDPAPAPAPAGDPAATPDPAPPADRAAQPLVRIQPAYPAAALRSREEGTVLLRVEVDAGGRPASVEIERSSRSRELDQAAREAVSEWTFRPAIENGVPVPATVTVPVAFSVE